MDIICYEHDQGFVISKFRQDGEFDYVDSVSEVEETKFFRFIGAKGILKELAESYPSPRKKEEIPTWFYIASNLSMRLHGTHSFHSYPYIVRCGGMLNAFGPQVAHKATHPETGLTTLSCKGFNEKNEYDRQTPCDQDYLRKFSKDTWPVALERWFNRDVAKALRKRKVFDKEGIFIGDASYVFVPDNDKYQNSAKMLFDQDDHPVSELDFKRMSPENAAKCEWKRCYKLVSLVHTNQARTFSLRVALRLLPGNEHECPIFYDMIDRFVSDVGENIIKRLILDRGFIDGERIAHCKRKYGIDTLIPLKKNMNVYQDVLGLLAQPEICFQTYTPKKREPIHPPRMEGENVPPTVRKRELKRRKTIEGKQADQKIINPPDPADTLIHSKVAGIEGVRTLDSCDIPLNVIINRETYADRHEQIWMLLDTKPFDGNPQAPQDRRDEYSIRTEIEEGHRQLKCFWDLASFTSRDFALVLNQIVFVILAFNLLQIYLRKETEKELNYNRQSRPTLLRQLLPTASVVIIYCQSRFATLSVGAYSEMLLTLEYVPKKKILEKIRRLNRSATQELKVARAI